MLVSRTEFERFTENAILKSIAEDKYLEDEENPNFVWMKERFFDKSVSKTHLLTVSSWLWKSISDTVAYYVGEPSIEYDMDWNNITIDYEALAYFVIWLTRKDWKLWIKYIQAENFTEEGGEFRSYEFYEIPSSEGLTSSEYYVLEQKYLDWKNENKLFKVNQFSDITTKSSYTEVNLDSITQTEELEDVEITSVAWVSVVVTREDETKELKDLVSTIKSTKNNIYAVDRKLTMVDTQLLQNVESFIIMKEIKAWRKNTELYNDWHKLNFSNFWKVIFANEQGDIKFVNNENALIKDAIEYEDNDIKRISSVSKVPLDFLWISTKEGNIWMWSRSLIHWVFIKKIKSIRSKIEEALQELEDKWLKIDLYDWEDVFAKSDNELVEELKIARESKIISRETAIKKYLHLEDDEVTKEIELLNLESNLWQNESETKDKGFEWENNKKDSEDNE